MKQNHTFSSFIFIEYLKADIEIPFCFHRQYKEIYKESIEVYECGLISSHLEYCFSFTSYLFLSIDAHNRH